MARRLLFVIGIWGGLFGLYLLFAGEASLSELLAALFTSAVAVASHLHTQHVAHRKLNVAAPWIPLSVRMTSAIARDTVIVGRGLLIAMAGGNPGGGMMIQPFDPGGFTPQAAARRGISILVASVAPNGYVIEVREPGQGILMHRLVIQPPAADPQWPV